MEDIVLQLKEITKIFPHPEKPVVANDHVSLDVRRGEVHALVGENGTGKSTLMNVLYGMLAPDGGEILLGGESVRFKNPRDAIAHGIGMVHQHFMLVPSFTAAENLVFTFEPRKGVFVDTAAAEKTARELSEKYGLAVDPSKKMSECPLSMQQRVEILKILFHGASILIFDEPTAVLTPQEAQELFKAFEELKKDGKSIIFITHKLREVMAVADRATVMRRGRVIDTVDIRESSMEDLAEKMVGKRIDVTVRKVRNAAMGSGEERETILSLDRLSSGASPSGTRLKSVSLEVREGEILGIAGVGGNGQELVVEAVTGLLGGISGGKMRYRGRDITGFDAHGIRRIGIAHITGERYVRGICAESDIHENLIMGAHRRAPWASRLFLKPKKLAALSDRLIGEFAIKTGSRLTPIMNLSGGNIQKCILARELNLAGDLIIAEEPTRGVDIGSIEFIHQQLIDRAKEGFGVLLVSTDLDEILSLSTRVLVMFGGEVMGEVDPEAPDADKQIGLLMAGVRKGEATA